MGVIAVRTTKIISLSLPPKAYEQAKKIAEEEGRTCSELFREALRHYIDFREWSELQRYGAGRAAKNSFTEDDVERLVDEHRAENA
jgi:metal-responsive CopG/Arc/MetJ family transcriptional regulator